MNKAMDTEARYFTTVDPLACSCADWKFRRMRQGGVCKHIRRLQEAEALLSSNAAMWATVEVVNRKP